jgi:drug/metabolite transporter (DMT)-like permease
VRRVVILAFIWGWSFLFIKVAVAGMTPTTVAGLRIALGAAALLATCKISGQHLPRDMTTWRHFAFMGVMYSAVPFTLLAWGEQRSTSALAAVCNATTPLFTAIAVSVTMGERLLRVQKAGLLVGFAGVALAAGLSVNDLTKSSTAGGLAAVAAAACYGVAFAYARRHLFDIAPLVAASGQLIVATVIMLPFAVGTSVISGIHLTPTRVMAICVLGLVNTGLAYAINYASIAEIGPTKASLVTYLVPVVAVTVGVVFLGEPFEGRLLVGAAVIVAGVALVQGRINQRVRRVPLVGGLLAALLLGGCSRAVGASQGSGSACGPSTQEVLDSLSTLHLLPGAPDPPYRTNPPTSGAHRVGLYPRGVVDQPIPRPVQVALLEKGSVIVQYRPGTVNANALNVLAATNVLVTVAPNPTLPAPVVATAWTWKLTCRAVSVPAVHAFVATHAGRGPGRP